MCILIVYRDDIYMKYTYNNIHWRVTDPISAMNIGYDKNDVSIPVPKEILGQELNIKSKDRITLIYSRGSSIPFITFPITGKTVKDLFKSLSKGMKTIIIPNNQITFGIYDIISNFIRSADRVRLISLYETKKLTPYHLIRDNYDFYEGNLKRNRNGIWTYGVGS